MKCIIIGRIKKRTSGLSRVTALWNEMLKLSPNWEVSLMSDDAIEWNKLGTADLIMLGGDSSVDDSVYEKIRKVTKKAPILSLSLIRNSCEDRKDMDRLNRLNSVCGNIYFAIWDETFRNSKKFSSVKDNLLSMPKPILTPPQTKTPPYSERSGVCIGHTLKTFNKRFSGRSSHDDINDVEKIENAN